MILQYKDFTVICTFWVIVHISEFLIYDYNVTINDFDYIELNNKGHRFEKKYLVGGWLEILRHKNVLKRFDIVSSQNRYKFFMS